MRLHLARTAATALAATALTAGALITSAGTAQAATTVHCLSALDSTFTGCDTPTGTGGPYTVNADNYLVYVPLGPNGGFQGIRYLGAHQTTTCQTLTPGPGSAAGSYTGINCTPPHPQ